MSKDGGKLESKFYKAPLPSFYKLNDSNIALIPQGMTNKNDNIQPKSTRI